jgi:hypothetical protein
MLTYYIVVRVQFLALFTAADVNKDGKYVMRLGPCNVALYCNMTKPFMQSVNIVTTATS